MEEKKKKEIIIPDCVTKTKYKSLPNCYILKGYEFDNDDSVVKRKRDKEGNIVEVQRICDGITMIQRTYDVYRESEYIDYEFYNNLTCKNTIIKFKSSEIGSNMMCKRLIDNGFTIYNNQSFGYFIISMRDAINKVIKENIKHNNHIEFFKTKLASSKYGFLKRADGTFDLNTFIDNTTIIENKSLKDIDAPLFQTAGSLEGWKKNMYEISECFKNPDLFKIALASVLTGVTVTFVSNVYDNPVYCIEAPTSAGKTLPAGCAATVWGIFTKNGCGITQSIMDTDSNRAITMDRLNSLSMIITDMQSAIIEKGMDWVIKFLYMQTEGTSGGHATIEGEARDNKREWTMALLFFAEADQFGDLTGGSDARLVVAKSHLRTGEKFIKDEIDSKSLVELEESDYGFAGPAFVKRMIEYNNKNKKQIREEINKLSNEINVFFKQAKKSNNLALLLYTYNKAIEWGVFPEEWGKMSIDDIITIFKEEKANMEPIQRVKSIWDKKVLNDPGVPFLGVTCDYEERKGTPREIRGRKEYVEAENCWYIYMSEENLQLQFDFIAKEFKINGYKFSINKIKDYDYAVRYPKNDRFQWNKTNITSKHAEKVYVLKIQMDTPEEEYKSAKELAPVRAKEKEVDELASML